MSTGQTLRTVSSQIVSTHRLWSDGADLPGLRSNENGGKLRTTIATAPSSRQLLGKISQSFAKWLERAEGDLRRAEGTRPIKANKYSAMPLDWSPRAIVDRGCGPSNDFPPQSSNAQVFLQV